jgi:hypothetical protein
LRKSDSRNRKDSPSNQTLHASPPSNFGYLHSGCRSGEPCRGADTRSDAQENLRYANADTASEKENDNLDRDKKEIADADAHTNPNLIAEEKTFAATEGRRITDTVADFFSEKETNPGSGRRGSHAYSQEEKSFTIAESDGIAFASQEEGFANAAAV